MKLRTIYVCILVGAFAPSATLALPAHSSHGASWFKKRSMNRNLIHEAHIVGVDDRRALSKVHDQIGMSTEEAKLYTQAMGQCICRTETEERSITCSLIGFNDRVWTNLHAFVDSNNKSLLSKRNLTNCRFENFGRPKTIRKLIFKQGSYAFATRPGDKEKGLDLAVVTLDKPIEHLTPIPMIRSFTRLTKGTTVLNLSGHQSAMKVDVVGEPIGQSCRVLGNWTQSTSWPTFATDCDNKPGGSGGLILARIDGNLLTVGMTVSTPAEDRFDGQNADLDEGLYTKHAYFVERWMQMGATLKMYQGEQGRSAVKAPGAK